MSKQAYDSCMQGLDYCDIITRKLPHELGMLPHDPFNDSQWGQMLF